MLLGQRIYDLVSASTTVYSKERPFRILDICSGSGCIPLLLAALGQGLVHVVGLDVDDRALAVARENIERNKLQAVARFEKFDLFDESAEAMGRLQSDISIEGRGGFGFDMVVSNPPYVSSEDMRKVEKTWHEGKFALQGKLRRPSQVDTAASTSSPRQTTAEMAVRRSRNGDSDVPKANGDSNPAAESDNNDERVQDGDDGYSFYRRILHVYSAFLDERQSPEAERMLQ